MGNRRCLVVSAGVVTLIAGLSSPAAAYMGPGVGLGLVATVFGAIAAFFMMLAGLVWYPVKIMLRKRRERKAAAASPSEIKTDAPAA